jgi:hypothetical protein
MLSASGAARVSGSTEHDRRPLATLPLVERSAGAAGPDARYKSIHSDLAKGWKDAEDMRFAKEGI